VPLGPAGAQHGEILGLKTGMAGLKHRIERVHQTISKCIGIDIERRMDEMRNISPEYVIIGRELECRSQALDLHLPPDLADPRGHDLA
jgi:hypothetical protein